MKGTTKGARAVLCTRTLHSAWTVTVASTSADTRIRWDIRTQEEKKAAGQRQGKKAEQRAFWKTLPWDESLLFQTDLLPHRRSYQVPPL